MHKSNQTPQDLEDRRPQAFRRIGDELRSRERFEQWQTLDDDELHALTMPPGHRGVPGPDETITLLEGFAEHCAKLRDGRRFEARLLNGEHQVRYASTE